MTTERRSQRFSGGEDARPAGTVACLDTSFSSHFSDPALASVADKLAAGKRLDASDGAKLFASPDLPGVWYLADMARDRMNGGEVFYAVNGHVTYTDVCEYGCAFCGFSKRPSDERPANGGDAMAPDEAAEAAARMAAEGVTEIHIVGGINPQLSINYMVALIGRIRRRAPRAGIKAFTAVEILAAARRDETSVEKALGSLRDAGLDALPGGGAEILVDAVRSRICPAKGSAAEWLGVHETAHRLGLRSTATMLFGHIESREDRVEHLMRLRDLQDRTGGFLAFVPIPYIPPKGTSFLPHGPGPAETLRTIAVSRLLLDNFPHIKAYWVAVGMETAQVALACGADDLHGTALSEKVLGGVPGAGAAERTAILRRAIERSGRVPVERDIFYRPVKRGTGGPSDWRVEEA
jgi:aminodeoxyfutalosine synthase